MFRTLAGTGIFSKLQKYNVEQPEQLFHIDFFKVCCWVQQGARWVVIE
jgi:hypothetical protein